MFLYSLRHASLSLHQKYHFKHPSLQRRRDKHHLKHLTSIPQPAANMHFSLPLLLTVLGLTSALPTPASAPAQVPVSLQIPCSSRTASKTASSGFEIRCTLESNQQKMQSKRTLIDIDPSVDVDLLNNLCLGIAVCNPVTVGNNNNVGGK